MKTFNVQSSTLNVQRSLPRYITAHLGGFNVRVTRSKVTYRAWVAGSYRPPSAPSPGGEGWGEGEPLTGNAALARAEQLRDRFLRIAGEVANLHRVKGHSNTGYSGISETVKWSRGSHSYPCFAVNWCVAGRQKMRRFTYGPKCSRTAALEQAVRHRERVTGLKLTDRADCERTSLTPALSPRRGSGLEAQIN